MTDDSGLRVEYVPVTELMTKLHPQNPKSHDLGAIIESYKAHGFVSPGTLDSRTGLFLCGHGRTEALAMMVKQKMSAPRGIRNNGDGWACPVVVGYESESDVQALAYLAADNKLTMAGGWNEPALAQLLQEVANSVDVVLESTGFDADELDNLLRDLGAVDVWNPPLSEDAENVHDVIGGFNLSSFWKDLPRENECSKYFLTLPKTLINSPIDRQFSRTNATATERIVKTYMRPGDVFFEMCCGWMTFSSTAKYFGFSGKGGDIWDKSISFCEKQLKAMKGDGVVSVDYADCRETQEPDNHYDFVHSNPPFFNLEVYGGSNADLAGLGGYELWLDAMGTMAREAERILKPGGIVNFVINDFRKDKKLILMHADFASSIVNGSNLVLHDIVIAELQSQSHRFWRREYDLRRTAKCHEYIITFKKPNQPASEA